MMQINLTYLLFYVPMIIAISLVFGATRHEDFGLILKHAIGTGRWITCFMAIIFAVILLLDWLT